MGTQHNTTNPDCPECEGEGTVEYLRSCNVRIDQCCGGCFDTSPCPACHKDCPACKEEADALAEQEARWEREETEYMKREAFRDFVELHRGSGQWE